MVDIEEIHIRDLYEKHDKREEYKGRYSIGKKIYRDDGEIDNEGFALYKRESQNPKGKD